ncbi:MAG TPA: prolyl oligopeptidase family serine peptidase [Candidatus Xenobia bacterium]|jgi:dipeptidyl aminopeptidase/acylaminoacyl peptidase
MRCWLLWLFLAGSAWAQPWLADRVVGHRGSVTIEQVFYPSDGLRIEARLFRPPGAGPHAGIVYAHDGVHGLSRQSMERCAELAEHGYVVLAPSYRGEDGSQGVVEVAYGEIDDVLAAATDLARTDGVDADRLAAIGTSHGALIVVMAAERSPVFKAVVEGYGVMDIYRWWSWLKARGYSTDDALSRRVYGRGPSDRPAAFAERDALKHLDRLQAPVLIVQGGADQTVPPSQADRLAQALRAAGKPFEQLRYPTEEHGFLIYPGDAASNRRRAEAWDRIRTFLEERLKPAAGRGGTD